jgi:DNA polymerase III alpha subunit
VTYALATIRTWFDLLQSTIAPQALLDAAQRLKMPAIGVVDHATTLGHVPLAKAARETGVHVAYGATITLDDGHPLRLLARNEVGYGNLCRLVTFQAQGQVRLPWQTLHDHRAGLYLLCGGRHGRLWHTLAAGDDRVLWLLARLVALAEREDAFVIEAQQMPGDGPAEHRTLRALLDLAAHAGVRAIATHEVQVLQPAESPKHRLVAAIDHQLTFWAEDQRLPPWRAREPSRVALPEPRDWHRTWEGLEHLVAGSAALLRDCQVELLGRRRFPGASLAAARIYDDLWSRAFSGLKQRYGQVRPDLIQRLTHEVDEVQAQEVGPFLLYAAELVERAAERGIKMVLQGSGTGSLLCYALGISPVDPLTTEALVFERFCGRHRGIGDLPDLDFGVPAGKERAVRALLEEMFGAERVAFLAAVVTLQERGAIRTAASAFGWDRQQIRLLHRKLKAGEPLDRYEQMVVSAGEQIAGQPYHLMRHPSGVIVAEEPLASLYGVGTCPDGPMLLANKDDVEALQLLKFDILPWYLLAIYDQAEASIHAAQYPRPDLWHVPGTDDRTGDMLEQADTRCIPYLQSPAMMTILRALRVRTEADIALALGALRPGASHTRDRLLAAIHGGSATLPGWEHLTPEHQAAVDEVLHPSRGALIYDEDLLRLAHLLGLSFADAERLARQWARATRAAPCPTSCALLRSLVAGAIRRSRRCSIGSPISSATPSPRDTPSRWHTPPGAWHASPLTTRPTSMRVSSTTLGWASQGACTRCWSTWSRRGGTRSRCVADGEQPVGQAALRSARCDAVSASSRRRSRWRRSSASLPRPASGRSKRERSLYPRPADTAGAGATDRSRHPGRARAQPLAGTLGGAARHARPADQASLLDDQTWPRSPAVEPESTWERALEEYETLGFPVSVDHPLCLYQAELAGTSLCCSARLALEVGRQVVVAGVIVAGRRIRTAGGRLMAFASLCDRTGVIELTLFEAAAERYRDLLSLHQ